MEMRSFGTFGILVETVKSIAEGRFLEGKPEVLIGTERMEGMTGSSKRFEVEERRSRD